MNANLHPEDMFSIEERGFTRSINIMTHRPQLVYLMPRPLMDRPQQEISRTYETGRFSITYCAH